MSGLLQTEAGRTLLPDGQGLGAESQESNQSVYTQPSWENYSRGTTSRGAGPQRKFIRKLPFTSGGIHLQTALHFRRNPPEVHTRPVSQSISALAFLLPRALPTALLGGKEGSLYLNMEKKDAYCLLPGLATLVKRI